MYKKEEYKRYSIQVWDEVSGLTTITKDCKSRHDAEDYALDAFPFSSIISVEQIDE